MLWLKKLLQKNLNPTFLAQMCLCLFKLNVETERQVADYYGVMSIPTLILFKDGEEVLRLTGLRKKEAMLEELKPYLS